jgi:hypothetical protein
MALFFHSVNALWFIVTFTSILIAYAMYVDWEKLFGTTLRRVRIPLLSRATPTLLTLGSLVVAIGFALAWNSSLPLRHAMTLNGLVDWRTIWWPILPLTIVLLLSAVAGIFVELTSRQHRMAAAVAVRSVEDNP